MQVKKYLFIIIMPGLLKVKNAVISNLTNDQLTQLTSLVSTIQLQVTSLETSIAQFNNIVAVLDQRISDERDVREVQDNVAIQQIATLASSVQVNTSNVEALTSSVQTNTSNVETLTSNVQTNTSKVEALRNEFDTIVGDFDGNLEILEGNIESIDENLEILEGNIEIIKAYLDI
jgi:chromosome segregation ATPase